MKVMSEPLARRPQHLAASSVLNGLGIGRRFIPEAISEAGALGLIAVLRGDKRWDVSGLTFEDLDGYRVVLQNAASAIA